MESVAESWFSIPKSHEPLLSPLEGKDREDWDWRVRLEGHGKGYGAGGPWQ